MAKGSSVRLCPGSRRTDAQDMFVRAESLAWKEFFAMSTAATILESSWKGLPQPH